MNLAKLTAAQQKAAIATQLQGDDFFDNLVKVTQIREENDRLYEKLFSKPKERAVLENLKVDNRLLLRDPPTDAHADPVDDRIYDPSMRQYTADGSRAIAPLPPGTQPRSAYLSSLNDQFATSGVLQNIDVTLTLPEPEGLADKIARMLATYMQVRSAAGHNVGDAEMEWQRIVERTDEIYVVAELLQPVFVAAMKNLVKESGRGEVHPGPLKDPVRVVQKAENDYARRFQTNDAPEACVGDMLRAKILCPTASDFVAVVEMLQGEGYKFKHGAGEAKLELIKMNNYFQKSDPNHFRRINAFLLLTCGDARISIEIQIHHKVLLEWSEYMNSHIVYQFFRGLFGSEYDKLEYQIDRAIKFFREVRGVPVLLSMLVLILKARKDGKTSRPADALPENTKILYELAINFSIYDTDKAAESMLRRVATHAHLKQSRQFSDNDVEAALAGHPLELKLWTELAKTERGAPLVKTLEMGVDGSGRVSGLWQFKHLSFQESLFVQALTKDEVPSFWEAGAEKRINDPFFLNAFRVGGRDLGDQMYRSFGKMMRVLPNGWKVINECLPLTLPDSPNVERFHLSNLKLDLQDGLSVRLIEALKGMLTFGCACNPVDKEGLGALVQAIRQPGVCRKLRKLHLPRLSKIANAEAWEPFADAIANKALPELRLLGLEHALGDGFLPLADAMGKGAIPHLLFLHLNEASLCDRHFEHLANALKAGALPEIEEIHVGENPGIQDAGAIALFDAARGEKVLRRLRQLHMYMTTLTDDALVVLGDVLAKGGLPMFEMINTHRPGGNMPGCNAPGDAGFIAMMRGLEEARHEHYHKELIFHESQAGDATIRQLVQLMEHGMAPCWSKMREIHMGLITVSGSAFESLLERLTSGKLPHLERLHFGYCCTTLRDEPLFALAEAVRAGKVPRLRTIWLDGNFFSSEAANALRTCVQDRLDCKGHPMLWDPRPGAKPVEAAQPSTAASAPASSGTDDKDKQDAVDNQSVSIATLAATAKIATAKIATTLASAPLGPPQHLVVGTLNFLGGDENPYQFRPPPADMKSAGLSESEWSEAASQATAAYNAFTFGEAQALVAHVDVVARSLKGFMEQRNLAADASCAELFTSKLLNLDNKWMPRRNPIVFALAADPDSEQGDAQRIAVHRDRGYIRKIVEYYAFKYFEECVPINAELAEQWAALLLFDLVCTHAVTAAREAFEKLARCSYLFESSGEPSLPSLRTQGIVAPLEQVLARQPKDAICILGCQELSADYKSMASLRSALPEGLQIYMRSEKGEVDHVQSGFFYSSRAKLRDITDALRSECRELLQRLKVADSIIKTTCRKLIVALFELSDGRSLVVVNVHCKSFKDKVVALADFVAGVRELTVRAYPSVAETIVLGDTNLDSKWPEEMKPEAQHEAVKAAIPPGTMPGVLQGRGPLAFSERLQARPQGGMPLRSYPPIRNFTTLKMRTRFQGQPDKAGELTVADKDFVFLAERGRVREVDTLIGGKPDNAESNLDLLMPSRVWPCDHFAVLCTLELDANGPSRSRRPSREV